ncbi:MAG: hypothetical protein AAB540_04335 [Patescibacteria group bacterium]
MTFKGGERFNGGHRPGRNKKGRRIEEDSTTHDGDVYGYEADPRPVRRTPERRPLPPARRPETVPNSQIRIKDTQSPLDKETEDILAGLSLVVTTEIIGEEARGAADTSDGGNILEGK